MTLLRLDHEAAQKLFTRYEEDTNKIKRAALQLSWYMRGGATYEDVLNMSNTERNLISKLVDDNLETTKKTQLPFF
jgi:DNA polymerase III delta subunit